MSTVTYFRNATGGVILPVSNTSFTTELLQISTDESEIYFEFYNDANGNTAVTPTAGTIVTSGSAIGDQFLEASQNATTQASTVSTPNATYTPPVLDGLVERARITLSGITGATHMRAKIFKHE